MSKLRMFPVRKKYNAEKSKWEKVPAIPKGSNWQTYDAPAASIANAENIGVVAPVGVVFIDLDTYKGVTTGQVDEALGCNLDWDGSELQRTISGGQHYGFLLPSGANIRQGDSLLGVQGFDTRCSGIGWICTGEGYEDLTLIGMVQTIEYGNLPMLPDEAVKRLSHGGSSESNAVFDKNNALDDLESIIDDQPLDGIDLDDMRAYLTQMPDSALDSYQSWLNIGFACHHQTAGSRDGLKLWAEVSKRSPHYDPQELKDKWPTFGRSRGGSKPLTFAHVIALAGGRKAIEQDRFQGLLDDAAGVVDVGTYTQFKKTLLAIPPVDLGPDMRGMLAAEVAKGFGKESGMTKADIRAAITPAKRRYSGDSDAPDWVQGWVYVETRCEFANVDLGYSIKREAFCAKYDRLPECVVAERPASDLALREYKIPTVVDEMFWPGADELFEYEGKPMLNSYRPQGIEPCGVIDDDGQDVVDLFLAHLHMLIAVERERQILIDWMAYVIQNPGQRVNWALLLQGAQGIGKTYFVSVLQMIMGDLVTNLDPTAITGRFTSWAHGSTVVAVEEIRISGTNKFETMDRLKPFITNTTVQIEEKGRDHRTVPNFTSYFLLTNYKDAIPLAYGDRRYCVIFSKIQSEADLYSELGGENEAADYFTHLFGESQRRADALARFLLDHAVGDEFKPKGRAPETDARKMMMGVSISPERNQVEDAIAKHECDVVGENLVDITWLNRMCELDGDALPQTRALSAILLEMGYSQPDPRRVKIGRDLHYFWYRPSAIAAVEAKELIRSFHKA